MRIGVHLVPRIGLPLVPEGLPEISRGRKPPENLPPAGHAPEGRQRLFSVLT
jgi:hypothetical protein